MELLWTFLCESFGEHMHTLLLCIYVQVESLGHEVVCVCGWNPFILRFGSIHCKYNMVHGAESNWEIDLSAES